MNQPKRTLNCVVVDANSRAAADLRGFIRDFSAAEFIGHYRNLDGAISVLRNIEVDVLFINVDQNDIQELTRIKEANRDMLLVLLSGNPRCQIGQVEDEVFDCLIQPVSQSRFKLAFKHIEEHFSIGYQTKESPSLPGESILIKSGGEEFQLKMADVLYIESNGEYLKYHTLRGHHMVLGSLRRLVPDLGPEFVQVHRSYVVNRNFVLTKKRQQLELIGNRLIPIGKTYKNAFRFITHLILL